MKMHGKQKPKFGSMIFLHLFEQQFWNIVSDILGKIWYFHNEKSLLQLFLIFDSLTQKAHRLYTEVSLTL